MTPLCHRQLPCLCRGSACSLWVPALADGFGGFAGPMRSDDIGTLTIRGEGWTDTGTGWCAGNMQATPRPDPAKENDDD